MSKKVLVVDDSGSMRQMVSFTLSEEGYEVTEAEDGQKGLDALESADPELIITDIHMPNVNGLEFIKRVRKNDKYKYTPIIVLTTESENEMQEKGKKAGASAWLVKPFTPEQLNETVKKVSG
jgi:two-component system chemotaxis response regulator CheY